MFPWFYGSETNLDRIRAQKNPRNSERGKQRAGEKLDEMSRQSEESS